MSERDIKRRIKSVSEVQKITRAMYLIASANTKKAKEKLNIAEPYFKSIQDTMKELLEHTDPEDISLVLGNEPKRRAGIVVITGDKGLCGDYNHNVIKLAEKTMDELRHSYLLVVGAMGREYFKKRGYAIDTSLLYTAQDPTYDSAVDIANIVLKFYSQGLLDEVFIVYTRYISSFKHEPTVLRVLPLDPESFGVKERKRSHIILKYEPSPQVIFHILAESYVKGVIYGALVESFASEQTARMTAMDSATKNAEELIDRFNRLYNKERQGKITREISEIISSSEVLR
ncbi:ATP synthase F1 subunit gamma [Calorimonas adulescens]|uniref:ATP synthase gamma chain n=1 Tax=Calorimonas adulescens TaxID=2606906 RepID=A0A5D8Q8R6_9THEO|nr:ATP synthase F1 subunit gamma [Calorimonas adulescens]TZE80777.1 ATP synthase F1 subunit gamma [Calorimonas adulescens]